MLLSVGREQGTGSWEQCATQLSFALGKLETASCLLSLFPTHSCFPFLYSCSTVELLILTKTERSNR